MNIRKLGALVMAGLLGLGVTLTTQARPRAGDVEIEIVDDSGYKLQQYPVHGKGDRKGSRAYIEAEPGENYAIRVRNHSDHRVGLVIAVDGRNIISGKQSYLARGERKYILGPHESALYQGWRTNRQRVHRFYFTDAADSYAEAFGDRTAMGVIAVAVYPEKLRRIEQRKMEPHSNRPHQRGNRRAPSMGVERESSRPGTGFGDPEWSPSRQVVFEPADRPTMHRFLKYEWRETLCRKGVISCDRPYPRNRFWPDDEQVESDTGFAPHPARDRYEWLKRELAKASAG